MAARKPNHPLQHYEKRRALGFAISRHLHHVPGHDLNGLHNKLPRSFTRFKNRIFSTGIRPARLWTYNNERPNIGIGGITPAQKQKVVA
ncbi:hypothetical protein ELI36_37575 [Rhizobium ruizarguesonis]|uniref:Transposase n=1 Tax=Rhizobium ruizarguesonis TaxID=2081791 RepID=A0ABY1WYA4_9HYPH|nr:hypothetical protein [Rhizobium ruizarguesonis]TAU13181.1 hypothetical protein ELI48_37710 [Rhizobium ruizarguesonis]TAU58422.1 hypothetical protein ELI45_32780 [Rhizobium ruizarguesonis]TAV03206.1 hypothetical protein ELI34_32870 [Rhizobium ruizarguesonis]TAV19138.1 hypothetical protein ELI36_37575 [Rhizobium ruizarguesonis]TAV20327.1 hypothetical protein ELI33_37780 [Rhizobium ruizarguesonis]